jgi:hypothetical protein
MKTKRQIKYWNRKARRSRRSLAKLFWLCPMDKNGYALDRKTDSIFQCWAWGYVQRNMQGPTADWRIYKDFVLKNEEKAVREV